MLVSEIKGDWANCLIANSHLWNRDIESIKTIDVSVFLRQYWGTSQYTEAVRQITTMIDLGWNAAVDHQIAKTPEIALKNPLPVARITVGDLCSWLEVTNVVRRRAILFALDTNLPIPTIIGLTWKQLRGMGDLSEHALALANANPRHLRIDYVFWEELPNMAVAPLFGLQDTMFEVSQGMGYKALRGLYLNAIPIDEHADYEDFTSRWCAEFDNLVSSR